VELSEVGLGETLVAATSVHVDHARQTFVTSRVQEVWSTEVMEVMEKHASECCW